MTADAPGRDNSVVVGRPRMARVCSSNSDWRWVTMVTMPVSWGRGESSENQTSSPRTKNSTPKRPRQGPLPACASASVTALAMSRAEARAASLIAMGCQDST